MLMNEKRCEDYAESAQRACAEARQDEEYPRPLVWVVMNKVGDAGCEFFRKRDLFYAFSPCGFSILVADFHTDTECLPMTLAELASPRFIALEIASLKEQIIKTESLLDKAQGAQKATLRALIIRMEQRIKSLEERSQCIQTAIRESISDAEILEMIRLFQNGWTWRRICKSCYGYDSSQACRTRACRAIADITF